MGESSKKKGFIIADDGTIIRGDSEDGKKGWIIIAVVLIAIVTIGLTMYINSSEWDNSVSYYEPDEWCDTVVEEPVSEPEAEKYIPEGYVDLGLPSGTLWKEENEGGFYDFDEAMEQYGDRLPTRSQIEELITYCQWTWMSAASAIKMTGSNNNYIIMPALGRFDCDGEYDYGDEAGFYWSSTIGYRSDLACNLKFSSDGPDTGQDGRCGSCSIRLVYNNR